MEPATPRLAIDVIYERSERFMATNSSSTPNEQQKEKPKQDSRFIIAMIPKKSRSLRHPRTDGEISIRVLDDEINYD
jgi:hypothetical protein